MLMKLTMEERYKGKGKRVCRNCGNSRALIRKYRLNVCRRCFREMAESIGFRKYGG
jgi:ribosomal protein S14